MKLVFDLMPTLENGRNSEGAFIRIPDGRILFAYSSYVGDTQHDHGDCNISAIYSSDEGESWSESVVIAKASDFGVGNIMSVSALVQEDGSVGLYFLVKENDKTTTIARAISKDGVDFCIERCGMNCVKAYYVVNNDRIRRMSDNSIVAPAAYVCVDSERYDRLWISVCLVSRDDGKTFEATKPRLTIPVLRSGDVGMQEPGIIEHLDGTVRLFARTSAGYQYESYSRDFMNSFTMPMPSVFQSPTSPMQISRDTYSSDLYAVYNPIPHVIKELGICDKDASWGRTPFVIRKSVDDGRTFGEVNIIENDRSRGFCYPALFFTADNSILCAYCRGSSGSPDKNVLARLGIMKISKDEIK